jgi:hypothetical protein
MSFIVGSLFTSFLPIHHVFHHTQPFNISPLAHYILIAHNMYNIDTPCHFCVISSTNQPSTTPSIAASPMTSVYVVLSTPIVFGFLDVAPLARGHVLLVPRAHHEKLSDLSPNQSAVLGFWLPIVSRGVMGGLLGSNWESKGMSWNVVQANGLHHFFMFFSLLFDLRV